MEPGYLAIEVRESIIRIVDARPDVPRQFELNATANRPGIARVVGVGSFRAVREAQAGETQLRLHERSKPSILVIVVD